MMKLTEALSTLEGFGWSYVATILMAGVVSYLGMFTVLRRIVFTGVALAQVAAAGVGAAFFVADHPRVSPALARFAATHGATVGSFLLTLLAAFGVRIRPSRERAGGDAIVGLIYVMSAAAAVLLVWRSTRGLAELREILAGEVLLASGGELALLCVALLVVASIHAVNRKHFLLVAYDSEFARTLGIPVGRTDLLFLATFATAVAFALRAGGLLLVFAYLVIPALIGLSLGRRLGEATVVGVASALGASLFGYLLAIVENLPVAQSIALVMVAIYLIAQPIRLSKPLMAIARWGLVASGAASLALVLWFAPGLVQGTEWSGDETVEETHEADEHMHTAADLLARARGHLRGDGSVQERVAAVRTLGALGGEEELTDLLGAMADDEFLIVEAAKHALSRYARRPYGRGQILAKATGDDPELATHAARALAMNGDPDGFDLLMNALGRDDTPVFLKEQVISELRTVTGQSFGFEAFGDDDANAAALEKWRTWLEQNRR